MDNLIITTCRDGSILELTLDEKSRLRVSRSYPQNVMGDRVQRGRLFHNEQCAPSDDSIPVAKTPNLHAGSSQAEMRKKWRLRCSLFPSLPLWRSWCFFAVTGERPVPLPQLWVGEPLARRRREQGGGAFPRTQLRVK
jgi:hypothetical protein